MKKGFTLIELLVVIAIIAILAAILFPVFAQAKVAAKKTQSINNQKQINLSLILYAGDYNDVLPRQDGCELNSSLNPAFNNFPAGSDPSPRCNGAEGFTFRMNHFSWQKWVLPYIKTRELFEHAGRGRNDASTPSCPGGQWSQCGQYTGSYALNLSLTGALNTWNRPLTANNSFRNSFLGGNFTSINRPSETALIIETGNPAIAFAPTAIISGDSGATQINYAPAIREVWARELMQWSTCSGIAGAATEVSGNPNEQRVFGGGMAVGYADGHVKYLRAGAVLAATPTAAEYGVGVDSNACGFTGGTIRISNVPNVNINYPFWGLGS